MGILSHVLTKCSTLSSCHGSIGVIEVSLHKTSAVMYTRFG
jgi:hypothetical protein